MTARGETEPSWDRLDRALDLALGPLLEGPAPPVVLFSGGVDSGLLAWEARHVPGASLFTVGLAGAGDLEAASVAAATVGLPWLGGRLDESDLAQLERELEPHLTEVSEVRRAIFVALGAAISRAPSGPLLCGQGADELFLGYAHYRGLTAEDASLRSSTDLRTLVEDDWPRTRRIAARWGRDVVAPYLHPEFVRAASAIPVTERLPGRAPKELFRGWARHRGLPELLASRPKRAVQYGTGVDRWLRRRHRLTP